MARAYLVVARNDIPDSQLQTLDIWPNKSQRNQAVDPVGQTHYNSYYLLDGVNGAVATAGAGPVTIDGDTYGLSAYLITNVANNPGNGPLAAAEATAIAARIEDRVALGLPLTLEDINAIIQVEAGGTSTLDGSGPDNSTGLVEDILRILAGERFLAVDGLQIGDGIPNFVVPVAAEFVQRALVELPQSVRSGDPGDAARLPIRGRNSFVGKAIPTTTPAQDVTAPGLTDTNFNDVPVVVDTGRLHQSAIDGSLSRVASSSWVFQNPAFTYGGGSTPALDIGGNNIGTDYAGRAVTVYAADGSVIA